METLQALLDDTRPVELAHFELAIWESNLFSYALYDDGHWDRIDLRTKEWHVLTLKESGELMLGIRNNQLRRIR